MSPIENSVEQEKSIDEPQQEESEQEEVMPNQVVNIEEAIGIDLDLAHSKANKVMQRVGEMLGIKPKESQIVSVTDENKEEKEEKTEIFAPKEVVNSQVQPQETTQPELNPLFKDNSITEEKKQETKNEEETMIDDTNFWFPSDTPDALNELPDLEVSKTNSDNFFSNNPIPDLNFPDLKVDFGNNSVEEQ